MTELSREIFFNNTQIRPNMTLNDANLSKKILQLFSWGKNIKNRTSSMSKLLYIWAL